MLRLISRAAQIYAAQILISMLAIAMLASAATLLDNPLLLEWHNAAAVFYDPVPTHIGLALITHQLGYFDILPLYVVLMVMAPAIAFIDRYWPTWLLPISLTIYIAVLLFQIIPPTWPVAGNGSSIPSLGRSFSCSASCWQRMTASAAWCSATSSGSSSLPSPSSLPVHGRT
jgi:hypothetical protein